MATARRIVATYNCRDSLSIVQVLSLTCSLYLDLKRMLRLNRVEIWRVAPRKGTQFKSKLLVDKTHM